MSVRAVVAVACAGLTTALGCNAVLGLDDYDIKARDTGSDLGSDAGSDLGSDTGDGCWGPSGAGGNTCFRCDAGTMHELLNACTTALCVPFNNSARIVGFDAGPPPVPEAGVEQYAIIAEAGPPPTVSCSSLPNPVYVAGSTGLDTILPDVGSQLKDVTVVMQAMASCDGVLAMLDETSLTGAADYYDASGNRRQCMIDGAPRPAVAFSDVPLATCRPVAPSDVADVTGPIQVFLFAAPMGPGENVISREAAFRVFGYSADSGVAPWLDPNYIFRRHKTSGTQIVIGENIGLPADVWSGVRVQSSRSMPAAIRDSKEPAKTIGITSADQSTSDEGKKSMRPIAYQHVGQACGFHPDSVPLGIDKRNVRDGHYALWAPIHMLARRNSDGTITDPRANKLIRFIDGSNASSDYLKILKNGHVVPLCAMAVQRDTPGGDIRPFLPPAACDCSFERADPASGGVTCETCTLDTDCTDKSHPKCRSGFCERS